MAAPAATAAGAGGYTDQPPFTVRALVSDTFARYGADVVRLFLVSAVATGLGWLGSFAVPMSSNPFVRPAGGDLSGVLGLVGFVAGIVGSSTTVALAEGARAVSFGRALRRGVERAGWVFLTSLLLGIALVALVVIALIPMALLAVIDPLLVVLPLVGVMLVFIWLGMRLSLSMPANVADNLNSIEGIKLSWRVTRPTAVWLRLLGATLVLGLMVAPAAIASMLLIFPALFGGGNQLALLLAPAVAFALFVPLSTLLSFSAYRRLVPPLQPSWTEPPAATPLLVSSAATPPAEPPAQTAPLTSGPVPTVTLDPAPTEAAPTQTAPTEVVPPWTPPAQPEPVEPPVAPTFHEPRLGTAGKALIALVLAIDVAGIAAMPYAASQLERLFREGIPGFPGSPGLPAFPGEDFVAPGQVAFGTGADVDACTIEGQLFFVTAGTQVEWVAALPEPVTPQDEVFVRVTRNGEELETTFQDPATYDCLASSDAEPGREPGIYSYDVIVNGTVRSTGSLIVQ